MNNKQIFNSQPVFGCNHMYKLFKKYGTNFLNEMNKKYSQIVSFDDLIPQKVCIYLTKKEQSTLTKNGNKWSYAQFQILVIRYFETRTKSMVNKTLKDSLIISSYKSMLKNIQNDQTLYLNSNNLTNQTCLTSKVSDDRRSKITTNSYSNLCYDYYKIKHVKCGSPIVYHRNG